MNKDILDNENISQVSVNKPTLQEVNSLLRKEQTRSLGLFLLNEINSSKLSPKQYLMYCYLKAKHFTILYNQLGKKDPDFLIQAISWLDQLVQCAMDHRIKLQQEFLYLRIKTKLVFISHTTDPLKSKQMLRQLGALSEHALSCYPNHSGLQSINKTIQS